MARAEDLLRQAREELYHARVLVRALRNRTKTDAAALFDCEQRVERLLAQIETYPDGSPRPKEAQGHDRQQALSQARL